MSYEICVIGNEALLFPFLQFGFTTYTPANDEELVTYLEDIIAKNYGIIYIEDAYCFKVKDILDKYRYEPTPIFVPIGEDPEGTSYYAQMVKEMTENAIGMNVLP
jgi:vacuolar-type H+-ATPase subunit F/Vma7